MKTSLLVAAMLGCTSLSLPVLSAQETALPAKSAMSMDKKMPQMQENMKKMQQQMDQLRVTSDPAERERLMQQHMQTMQDHMMSMRGGMGGGMGGMTMQGSTGPGGMQHGATGSDAMKRSMMAGMDSMQTMPMSGETDKDFAMMMKIHHQQAVDMAQVELDQGKSPAMKTMARKIIAAQKKEIAQFDQWLSKQK